MPRELDTYLWDAIEAASDLIQLTRNIELLEIEQDRNLRHLIERKFEIIGEILRRLYAESPDLFATISDARGYINLRNVIAHNYSQVNASTLLTVCQSEVGLLEAQIRSILEIADDGAIDN
jgi:uncharacterized protein with HEPN domain